MKMNRIILLLITIAGIHTGITIIGRYNVTNIVFISPFFYILIAVLLISYSHLFK